jgi:hypothetical protein
VLVLGIAADVPGTPIAGIQFHITGRVLLVLVAATDGLGSVTFPMPLGGVPRGAKAYFQFVWLNTASCGGFGNLSASNALEVAVQ